MRRSQRDRVELIRCESTRRSPGSKPPSAKETVRNVQASRIRSGKV
jgi:hypothetical protein